MFSITPRSGGVSASQWGNLRNLIAKYKDAEQLAEDLFGTDRNGILYQGVRAEYWTRSYKKTCAADTLHKLFKELREEELHEKKESSIALSTIQRLAVRMPKKLAQRERGERA